jgi:hypothetical protein
MNDIFPRNIGAGGVIFDPALHPIHQALRWTALGGSAATGKIVWDYTQMPDPQTDRTARPEGSPR